MMRGLSSSLLRWLTATACGLKRIHFRRDEAEFPAASQNVCNLWTSRGPRAADSAPSDALRPFNNWVNIEDHYELAFIRETLAPFAWRAPTKGQSVPPRTYGGEGPQENILATARRIFRRRERNEKTNSPNSRVAQWRTATAAGAQT